MVSDLIYLTSILIFSAFFSASELAFVLSNKLKIELRARQNITSAKNAYYFLQNQDKFFSTILISNNAFNIAFASLITVFLSSNFHISGLTILFISTVILLIFGELIPKFIARENSDSTAFFVAIPLRLIMILIYPFVLFISKITSFLTNLTTKNNEVISHLFDTEEIKGILNESSEAGVVDSSETEIISKVIELRKQRVYETITPRTEVVGVEINSSIDEVIETFIESGYSKLPVYEENMDNIRGVIFAYDMFNNPSDIKSIMREIVFVPETKKSMDTLNELLAKRVSIAAVIDEFGGTAGIVTVEDIIEEMLGEIQDEYDTDEKIVKKIDEYTFIINGKAEIDLLNEDFRLMIPIGDYETFGGFITGRIGRIPERGESFDIEHFKIFIVKSDRTKIELIKVYIDQEKFIELQ